MIHKHHIHGKELIIFVAVIKKIFHIILASVISLLIIVSTSGSRIFVHYCNNAKTAGISLVHHSNGCGGATSCSIQAEPTHANRATLLGKTSCCNNYSVHSDIPDLAFHKTECKINKPLQGFFYFIVLPAQLVDADNGNYLIRRDTGPPGELHTVPIILRACQFRC